MLQSITECCRVLQGVTECYRVLQSVTECYSVLQSITEYNRVLQNITEYYRVFLAHILGPISGLVEIKRQSCLSNMHCSVDMKVNRRENFGSHEKVCHKSQKRIIDQNILFHTCHFGLNLD